MASDKDLPTQGRDAPAYQEYAASMIARFSYREMSLAERGLLYTLRNECWVNRRLPSDPARLARVLGYPAEEVRTLLPRVMDFFEIQGESLVCPDLEHYRTYQDARRARMSEGGKKGAATRKGSKQALAPDMDPASTLQAPSKVVESGLQALRSVQSKPDKSKPAVSEYGNHDAWINDFERNDSPANEYAQASRGH